MKIYTEILRKTEQVKPETKSLKVISTAKEFWRGLKEEFKRAKVVDASYLMPQFIKTDNFRRTYQRNIVYEDLSPIDNTLWVEVEEEDSGASLGALLSYSEVGDEPEMMMEAAEYGIRGPFQWRVKSYSFIKQPLCKAMPLNWCLIEYIKQDGSSAGSLLKPVALPEGVYQNLAVEVEHMRLLNHGVATLISDLGLYLIEAVHRKRAVLKSSRKENCLIAVPAL